MNLKAQRAALIKAANQIIDAARAAERDLTSDEITDLKQKSDEIADLNKKIEAAEKSAEVISQFAGIVETDEEDDAGPAVKSGSIGDRFVASDAFRAFRKSHPSGVGSGTPIRIEAKGIGHAADLGIGTKATITTQTGFTGPVRDPAGYYNYLPGDEPLTFLSLVTTGTTNIPYSEYARIVSETDNAAVVPEGGLKPLSDITTGKAESKAYTYADGFDITNQTLADDGALAALMQQRIQQHVRAVVENKLLNGTGAGTEPEGILHTTGTLAQAFDTDVVTTLARALELFESTNRSLSTQAIVMNPRDVWNLRLLKDTTGAYLLGNPLQQGLNPTPFGVPLVRSSAVAAGTALVGRFDSMHFLELEALNVMAFNQHKDYAQRNMTYVRAEMRGRQVFYAPRELVVADLTA